MTAPAATGSVIRSREPPPALQWRVVSLVLLPFAGGFYLSYLYRSVNALIADHLTNELGIGAAQLGLLTSVYLLVSAAAQIPLGVMLDRFGPRRVQGALLVVAAAGALQFATATDFWELFIGRALIGLGVATALMAGIKAVVMWVPKERLALANGILLGLGTLGAVTATMPAEMVIAASGWRTLFVGLATATLASATSMWLLVPERSDQGMHRSPMTRAGLLSIARDRRFKHLAPLAGLIVGTSWALQGLWAARGA
jgi:nitrate/nitrite transporter NarK